jgi:hypothetical protein
MKEQSFVRNFSTVCPKTHKCVELPTRYWAEQREGINLGIHYQGRCPCGCGSEIIGFQPFLNASLLSKLRLYR